MNHGDAGGTGKGLFFIAAFLCPRGSRTRSTTSLYRIKSISIPTLNPAHARSAVSTRSPRACASARQARSPRESPADRVRGRRNPAVTPCSRSNAAISIGISSSSSRITSSGTPAAEYVDTTSARFTVLMIAPAASASATRAAPASPLSAANTAEASSTTLLTSRRGTALGDQFGYQVPLRRNVAAKQRLGSSQ